MVLRPALRLALGSLALAMLFGATGPRGCGGQGTTYSLRPESALTQGCFDPCDCPIATFEELDGFFTLVERTPPEPSLFREFDVQMVRWTLQRGSEVVPITGSGHYRVGGEFAVMQQLELDLQIGADPVQHFDSGLVAGGGQFPDVDVTVSVNGQFCYDTVIDVFASPLSSSGTGAP
jgi:hypothetical protein